jgi:hypothetical protein
MPTPLGDRRLDLRELRSALGPTAVFLAGFGYSGAAGIAKGGFAVRLTSSVEIYGTVSDGQIQFICFSIARRTDISPSDAHNLAGFAASKRLLLVDWCRTIIVQPFDEDYAAYFFPPRAAP